MTRRIVEPCRAGPLFAVGLAFAALGCASDRGTLTAAAARDLVPTTVVVDSGNAQLGPVTSALPLPLIIHVLNVDGRPVAGARVTFVPDAGAGVVVAPVAQSDGAGRVVAGPWTLGGTAGLQYLTAQVDGGPSARIVARGTAGPAAALAVVSGESQSGFVGQPTSLAPVVRVTDANGNPVTGASVAFVPGPNSGTVAVPAATTDLTGSASPALWTMGPTIGTQVLLATVPGTAVAPITIHATGVRAPAPVPTTLTVLGGNAQIAAAGTPTSSAPVVQLLDANADPLVGTLITCNVTAGAGVVVQGVATTDARGIASCGGWTLGRQPGANTLVIGVPNGPSVTLSASGIVGPASRAIIVAGDGQQAVKGAVAQSPSLLLTDQFGNAVVGAQVVFSISAGGGTLTGGLALTDANGLAVAGRWTLGVTADQNTITAIVVGAAVAPVTFSAAGT